MAYGISKRAVVAISEALCSNLKIRDAHIGCSVLCPIFIRTQITQASRNRPAEWSYREWAASVRHADMADAAFDAIRAEQFYIWPGDKVDDIVRARSGHILMRTNPDPRPFG
jgi:short-subunit dehydrogenase